MRHDLTPLQGSYITMGHGLAARMRDDAQAERNRAHALRKQADDADKIADALAERADQAVVTAVAVVAADLGVENPVGKPMLFPGDNGVPSAIEWSSEEAPEPVAADPVQAPRIMPPPEVDPPTSPAAEDEPGPF